MSWQFQHWIGGQGGRPSRLAFAHYPPTKIGEAREQAEKLRGEATSGIDVVSRRKQLRANQREALGAITVKEAWEKYYKRRSVDGRYWSELKSRFENEIIAKLGAETKVASLTKAQLRSMIEDKEETHPVAARTMFEALRPFFKWCVERDAITVSPLGSLKPPPLPESRDRILSDDELRVFWKATSGMFLWGPFYRLLLLTAQRREEVGAMQWCEIDRKTLTWTIPGARTKNGKEHTVHLSPQAWSILKDLPRLKSDYVFTTTLTTPIQGYSKAKRQLDGLTKLSSPWRVHDLRRTAASGMAKLGFQPHVIERVLNHVSGAQGGLVAVYQRYEYLEERKRAIEAWGSYVEALIADRPIADNVVPIRA